MKKPLNLSIIIPCYNREQLISQTIESILNQLDFYPLEIIVLDDKSSDRTVQVLESLKPAIVNNRIEFVLKKMSTNVGPSKLRNIGVEIARGDFVAFLDSDDSWNETKLITFAKDLKNKPEIVFWSNKYSYAKEEFVNSDFLEKIPFLRQLLRNHAQCSCVVIKRKHFLKFREDMRYNEDHECFTRMSYHFPLYLNHSKLTVLGRPLMSKGGLSSHIWRMRIGEIKTYFYSISYCPSLALIMPFLLPYSILKHIRLLTR
ncbi:MAG: glycosyltransferase family 2 protein [Bacteriovoracaceae bacterium]|nr:glycosyltransferase family 2 protein [Bacteriovoracaceae bacterium]